MKPLLLTLSILVATAFTSLNSDLLKTYGTLVDARGQISMPQDFRKDYAHLGSWFVPEGDASGFHDVYTQQETLTHYRETGKFPDGAVLVKELRGHSSKPMTTGTPSWANDQLKQWFVMVKDEKSRFKDNTNWGEGWGWALFKPGQKGNLSTNYIADCMGCHVPAKGTDWIYIEGYPTLKK